MENDSTVISNITNLSQGYNSEYFLLTNDVTERMITAVKSDAAKTEM
jgi:hypothetical protein